MNYNPDQDRPRATSLHFGANMSSMVVTIHPMGTLAAS